MSRSSSADSITRPLMTKASPQDSGHVPRIIVHRPDSLGRRNSSGASSSGSDKSKSSRGNSPITPVSPKARTTPLPRRALRSYAKKIISAHRLTDRLQEGLHARRLHTEPGSPPGLDVQSDSVNQAFESIKMDCKITLVDYSSDKVTIVDSIRNETLDQYLQTQRPAWSKVRWINVEGLSWDVLRAISIQFDLHPLSIEDVLHVPQRVKRDVYDTSMYISLILLSLEDAYPMPGSPPSPVPSDSVNGNGNNDKMRFKSNLLMSRGASEFMLRSGRKCNVNVEQVSIFITPDHTVISIFDSQQSSDLITTPILSRLMTPKTLMRSSADSSFLMNSLIDTIVDHALPVVEYFGNEIGGLEYRIMQQPQLQYTKDLHLISGELTLLKRTVVPTQHLINSLRNVDQDRLNIISPVTRTYLNDVQDHIDTVVENINTLQGWAKNLIDLNFNIIAYQTNESMKTLAVVSALFLPITFIAGVYGTNFQVFPEIGWQYGYLYFWVLCTTIFVGMVAYFKTRHWF